MKERPILFSGPMVRAILEGRKTQTRRVVKPVGNDDAFVLQDYGNGFWPYRSDDGDTPFKGDMELPIDCPYGRVGDRLWVRETFSIGEDLGADWVRGYAQGDRFVILDGGSHEYIVPESYEIPRNAKETHNSEGTAEHWREFGPIPSIFMPRWASRITLEITGVRVERLQDISEADALAEGVKRSQRAVSPSEAVPCFRDYLRNEPNYHTARDSFSSLWVSLNGPESWQANPWVWCISFKRVQP